MNEEKRIEKEFIFFEHFSDFGIILAKNLATTQKRCSFVIYRWNVRTAYYLFATISYFIIRHDSGRWSENIRFHYVVVFVCGLNFFCFVFFLIVRSLIRDSHCGCNLPRWKKNDNAITWKKGILISHRKFPP